MFDNPFSMVVAIVLIIAISRVLRDRYRAQRPSGPAVDSAETRMLRDEVGKLKERVQVLERVITDQREASDLSLEIERLRER